MRGQGQHGGVGVGQVIGPVTIHQAPPPAPAARGLLGPSGYLQQVRRIAPPDPPGLIAREAELADMAAFCLDDDRGPYLWWRAGPWAGKSALMSTFVLHPPEQVRDRVKIVSFFITSRLAAQDTRAAFTTVLLEQLADLTGEDLPPAPREEVQEAYLLDLLSRAAHECRDAGGRLVLVVDGLDEDRGVTLGPHAHSIAGLLPPDPPAGMRIIVAGRPNPPIPQDVPDFHPLRDPGIIRLLTDSPHARDLQRLGQQELHRLVDGSDLEQDLLGLLTAARGGLSGPDLEQLVGAPVWQIEKVLHSVAGRTFTRLTSTWNPHGGPEVYLLGHEELHTSAARNLGRTRLAQYRDRIHAWAAHYRDRGWPPDTPEYLLRGYQQMLYVTGDLARLVECATDTTRHARMLDLTGGDATALAETRTALTLLAAQDRLDPAMAESVARSHDDLVRDTTPPPGPDPIATRRDRLHAGFRAFHAGFRARSAPVIAAAIAVVVVAVVVVGAVVAAVDRRQHQPLPEAARCGGVPVDGPMSSVTQGPGGNCFGFTDTAEGQGAGPGSQAGFGRDGAARHLQAQLLAGNQPLHAGDLTVVWLGDLTCATYTPAGACGDAGQNFESEVEQLRGIQFFRQSEGSPTIHVVIANAGARMGQAVAVAKSIVARKGAFGRVVVIGGDESYATTRTAISTLVTAGIPFISPTLTSDLAVPGQPFLPYGTSGYLQLLPPNQDWANRMIKFVVEHTPAPTHRQVIIYHVASGTGDQSDEYTESLTHDLMDAAGASSLQAQQVSDLNQLPHPESICAAQSTSPTQPPPAIVYADRGRDFPAFVASITKTCGRRGPALLIGNDSVTRVMTDDPTRKTIDAPWPLAYFKAGDQCTELQADARQAPDGPDAVLLRAALPTDPGCRPESQLDPNVSLTWDTVRLAVRIVSTAPGTVPFTFAHADQVPTANGALTITSDRITPVTPQPLCVYTTGLPPASPTVTDSTGTVLPTGRSINYCAKINRD